MYLKTPRGSARAIGDVYLGTPRGSVRRFGMGAVQVGDVVITDPNQDHDTGEIQMPDDYVSTWNQGNQDETVATVGPIITGIKNAGQSTLDWINQNLLGGGVSAPAPGGGGAAASVSSSGISPLVLLLLGGAGYVGYRALTKKKRKR